MTTLLDTAAPHGIVGQRQLVAFQTIDIGRLTSHPLHLVPEGFIAVSGRGPKGDSNGSGKTTFLAAVSLLLGEAQWRLTANGAPDAAGLLFQPDAAGMPGGAALAHAPHGYIIGVFADPGDPRDAVSVWVRLNSAAPHLAVRWSSGLHVAEGDRDLDRLQHADQQWARLGRTTELGPRRMAEVLYGQAPRCMAYLDTSLRPSAPSLLSQQMTEMKPAHIAQALIDLTGKQDLLENEERQRGRLIEAARVRGRRQEEDQEARRREDGELRAVRTRNEARRLLAEGERWWRRHFALGLIEVQQRHDAATEDVEEARGRTETAAQEVAAAREHLERCGSPDELRHAAAAAQERYSAADAAYAGLRDELTRTTSQAEQVNEQCQDREAAAASWDGTPVEALEVAQHDARASADEAVEAVGAARAAARQAEAHLEEVRGGGGGDAGAALGALHAVGIDASPLLDVIDIEDGARGAWEPRLWLYRGTVVVQQRAAAEAADVLSSIPGASWIVADGEDHHPLPHGISSRLPLGRALAVLEQRYRLTATGALVVTDTETTASTAGGFTQPVSGHEARLRLAEAQAQQAGSRLEKAQQRAALAGLQLKEAGQQLAAGTARAELELLRQQAQALRGRVESLSARAAAADAQRNASLEALVAARSRLEQIEASIRNAEERLAGREKEADAASGSLADLTRQRDELNLGYWLEGFGGDAAEATAWLQDDDPAISSMRMKSARNRAADSLRDAAKALRDIEEYAGDFEQIDADRLEDSGRQGFQVNARAIVELLDARSDHDVLAEHRIVSAQQQRADSLAQAAAEEQAILGETTQVQDMITATLMNELERISGRLDQLDRANGGFGAELAIEQTAPGTAPGSWQWRVTPRWRRSAGGPMVDYRRVANGAQVKVFAINLVLAALLAAEGGQGRVMVLDELGNSLGDVNRRSVLEALNRVANTQRITVLGAAQDSVIADAAGSCVEVLWFSHASTDNPFNQPTRMWAFDDNQERVELTRDWITAGRHLV